MSYKKLSQVCFLSLIAFSLFSYPKLAISAVCGDGIFPEGREACDDSNNLDGDGCSAFCEIEQTCDENDGQTAVRSLCYTNEGVDVEGEQAVVCADLSGNELLSYLSTPTSLIRPQATSQNNNRGFTTPLVMHVSDEASLYGMVFDETYRKVPLDQPIPRVSAFTHLSKVPGTAAVGDYENNRLRIYKWDPLAIVDGITGAMLFQTETNDVVRPLSITTDPQNSIYVMNETTLYHMTYVISTGVRIVRGKSINIAERAAGLGINNFRHTGGQLQWFKAEGNPGRIFISSESGHIVSIGEDYFLSNAPVSFNVVARNLPTPFRAASIDSYDQRTIFFSTDTKMYKGTIEGAGLVNYAELEIKNTQGVLSNIDEPKQMSLLMWCEECGNGRREGDEQCDDSNKNNGDGCNTQCQLEDHSCIDGEIKYYIDGVEVTLDEANDYGIGTCHAEIQVCVDGEFQITQDQVDPQNNETCNDGLDNNCDGFSDENCECDNGDTQQCGTPTDVGACDYGTQTCQNNRWGTCVGAVPPIAEACDGIDNDCDGEVDNGVDNAPLTQICTDACNNTGTQTCGPDSNWSQCSTNETDCNNPGSDPNEGENLGDSPINDENTDLSGCQGLTNVNDLNISLDDAMRARDGDILTFNIDGIGDVTLTPQANENGNFVYKVDCAEATFGFDIVGSSCSLNKSQNSHANVIIFLLLGIALALPKIYHRLN